jgi:hypothetical protein
VNDQLYNHPVFGPLKGKGGNVGKSGKRHLSLYSLMIFLSNKINLCVFADIISISFFQYKAVFHSF